MKIESLHLSQNGWMTDKEVISDRSTVGLVLVFGDTDILSDPQHYDYLKDHYPSAHIVGTSTAGNIQNGHLSDAAIVATAISFENAYVEVNSVSSINNDALVDSTRKLIEELPQKGLRHVFLLADGLYFNGSHIAQGANSIRHKVPVSGGLGGDGFRFERVLMMADDIPRSTMIVAIGFYGKSLRFDVGSKAGWNEFGAERLVTRSEGNIVYEIDNRPAISLYEAYLGDYIKDLPASALLFPLSIKASDERHEVVRVMMGVNKDGSITFAGDVPEGSVVRLMKTNVNHLVDGAKALANSLETPEDKKTLALTVSCSGRRSVLKQLVDEELVIMQEQFGADVEITGFYSYGELAPFQDDILNCRLHNQTMTLTIISEE